MSRIFTSNVAPQIIAIALGAGYLLVEMGVDFAWWVPYFLAHCNYWMIFGAFWSHLEIPIDLRYFISVLSYGP